MNNILTSLGLITGFMSLKRKRNRRQESQKLDDLARDPIVMRAAIAAMQDALACLKTGDIDGTIRNCTQALHFNPKFAEAHCTLGIALWQSGDAEGAIFSLRRAITIKPDHALAIFHLGELFAAQEEYGKAIDLFQRTIELCPEHVEAYNKLGQAYFRLFQLEKSQKAYEAGLEIAQDHSGLHHNLALTLMNIGRRTEALAMLKKAIDLSPDNAGSLSYYISTKSHLCDWTDIESLSQKAVEMLLRQPAIIDPFTFQCLPTAPGNEEQFVCATKFGVSVKPAGEIRRRPASLAPAHENTHGRRIRVGYVSMDFRSHPMAYLMTDVLRNHDRSHLEIYAYSFGPPDDGPERQQFKDAVDHFTDIQGISNLEAAQRIYDDRIDILIDRKGYTFGNRLEIFSHRPAPIQVNYLAFGGTMGVDYIDYVVLDEYVVPPDQQCHYSERLVYLPDTYQPNSFRPVSDILPTRAECGLAEDAFVFCCFNQTYKITPKTFDLWMRILVRTPGSILWLLKPDEETAANLRREAIKRGVAPERLAFAPRTGQAAHLARHRLADLFLDTLAVNALTTASDALHMGIPIITCPGETFVSRGAGSILRALEMPELIAKNLGDYEELAVSIATSPDYLRQIKEKISLKRTTAPLFDSRRYTRHLDAAFMEMWKRHQSGAPPKPFSIASIP